MTATNAGIICRAIYEGNRALRRTARQFGADFRAQRLRLGVSQAAVARSIGVTRSVICRLEAGDEKIGPRSAREPVPCSGRPTRWRSTRTPSR